jgi:hypothetical protein
MEIVPMVEGNMHLMANPRYAYSKARIIETGKRMPFENLYGSTVTNNPNSI